MKAFKVFLLLFFVLGLTSPAQAYDFNARIRKQQEAKQAKRWSLSEWLAQKSKVKLMDAWLGYNLPSPYEFYISLDTSSVNREVETAGVIGPEESFRNYRGAMGAWVTAVGLYGEYESSPDEELEQWKALFMVRLLGTSDQSTNFVIHYGLMGQDYNDDPTQFQVGGGSMNLYIIKAFALTGKYEYLFKAESEAGLEQEGSRWEAGAFIEYGALRIYGSFYQESIDFLNTPQPTTRLRNGILYGTRFYF